MPKIKKFPRLKRAKNKLLKSKNIHQGPTQEGGWEVERERDGEPSYRDQWLGYNLLQLGGNWQERMNR